MKEIYPSDVVSEYRKVVPLKVVNRVMRRSIYVGKSFRLANEFPHLRVIEVVPRGIVRTLSNQV